MSGKFFPLITATALAMVVILTGCGGSNSPTAPAPARTREAHGPSGHFPWGVYSVSIDPVTMEAEIVPFRNAEFTANVTRFMQPPASPVHMVSIRIDPSSDPSTGYFALDITLRHPFQGISKFNGFDVRGILLADGSLTLNHDSSAAYAGPGDTILLNADGYTRWWNWVEFMPYETIFGACRGGLAPPNIPTATLNGFKYFADDLSDDKPAYIFEPAERGIFRTTSVNSRRYEIQFRMDGGAPVFDFNYAIDASWALPDPDMAPDYPPEAYPPDANCAEAHCMVLRDAGSTAWYVDESNNGGFLKLEVDLADWQSPYNPSGVPGELAALWFEGEVIDAPVDLLPLATVGDGGPVSSVFNVELHDLSLRKSGANEVWLIAENFDPNTYEPNIDGNTDTWTWPASPLAAYHRTSVVISDIAPERAPEVYSIDPPSSVVGSEVDALVTGAYFADGCSVELRESGGGMVIEADNEVWIDENNVSCTIDLTGANIGLYDVAVINPSLLEGVLIEGFEVLDNMPDDIIYVDDSNDTGIEDGTMDHPFNTIPEGLWTAPPGFEVWVDDSGNQYTGSVVLAEDVLLKSENWDDSDGGDMARIFYDGTNPVVTAAEGAAIDGFMISGSTRTGIDIDGVAATVTACHIDEIGTQSGTKAGIRVVNSTGSVIDNCKITNIRITTSYTQGYGIYLSNSPITVADTMIHSVIKSGNYDQMAGIYATGCVPDGDDVLTITHCEIYDVYPQGGILPGSYTPTYGVLIDSSTGVELYNNIVHSITGGNYNNAYGIRFSSCDSCSLVNNVIDTIEKAYYYGVAYGLHFTTCTDLDIRNTIITNVLRSGGFQTAYGVCQSDSTYLFEYNDVYNCSTGLYDGVTPGTGCISAYPVWVNPEIDYHLGFGSPCLDTGDPSILDPDDSRSNMGAYGGPGGDW